MLTIVHKIYNKYPRIVVYSKIYLVSYIYNLQVVIYKKIVKYLEHTRSPYTNTKTKVINQRKQRLLFNTS